MKRWKHGLVIRVGVYLLFFLSGLWGTGCKATELEDRSFPMMAIVDCNEQKQVGFFYVFPILRAEPDAQENAADTRVEMVFADSYAEAFFQYEKSLNKEADYNHMKVLLCSTAFLENQQAYEKMLDFLWEEETFPRNTYVCVTDDVEGILSVGESYDVDLGTYLEELLENHEFGKEAILPTVGTMMDEQKNKCLTLELPLLTVRHDTMVWENFYRLVPETE